MKTELVIFILILLGNGAVALWKKYKQNIASPPAQDPRPSLPPARAATAPSRPAAARAPAMRQPIPAVGPPAPVPEVRGPGPEPFVLRAAVQEPAPERAVVARAQSRPPARVPPTAAPASPATRARPRNRLRHWVVGAEILGAPRWRAPLH